MEQKQFHARFNVKQGEAEANPYPTGCRLMQAISIQGNRGCTTIENLAKQNPLIT